MMTSRSQSPKKKKQQITLSQTPLFSLTCFKSWDQIARTQYYLAILRRSSKCLWMLTRAKYTQLSSSQPRANSPSLTWCRFASGARPQRTYFQNCWISRRLASPPMPSPKPKPRESRRCTPLWKDTWRAMTWASWKLFCLCNQTHSNRCSTLPRLSV